MCRRRIMMASAVVMVAALFILASALLATAIGLGITRGEMRAVTIQSTEAEDRLSRAAAIALALFLGAEAGTAYLILKAEILRFTRPPWPVRFVGVTVVMVLCSYLLVLLAIRGTIPYPARFIDTLGREIMVTADLFHSRN